MKVLRSASRNALLLLTLAFVLVLTSCGRGSSGSQPQIGGSLFSSFGAIPGDESIDRQRFHYEASLSNTGAALGAGWRWDIVLAPELAARALHISQDPAATTAGVRDAWAPGETHQFTGSVDFDATGLTKEAITAIPAPVTLRITDAAGNEVARLPVR